MSRSSRLPRPTMAPLALVAGFAVSGVACEDPEPRPIDLPGASGDRRCELRVLSEDAWGPEREVLAILFDDPGRDGAWAVVGSTGDDGRRELRIRRRPASGAEPAPGPVAIEQGDLPARFRLVAGEGPGQAWLERDRLEANFDTNELERTAYDLWRLDVDQPDFPAIYKPQVEQATSLPGVPDNYDFRVLTLGESPFVFAVPRASTAAIWSSFCNGIRQPIAAETPPQAVYFCFFPLRSGDLTLGPALEAGPITVSPGFRIASFDVNPISNLRATGFAMVPFVMRIEAIFDPGEELPPIPDTVDLVTAKFGGLGGVPVVPNLLLGVPMGSSETSNLQFAPVRAVQDGFNAYFFIENTGAARQRLMAWTDVLAYDRLPLQAMADELPPGAIPLQLADGAAMAWIADSGELAVRTFSASGTLLGREDRVEFGALQLSSVPGVVREIVPAGPGHLLLRLDDGADLLGRLECD